MDNEKKHFVSPKKCNKTTSQLERGERDEEVIYSLLELKKQSKSSRKTKKKKCILRLVIGLLVVTIILAVLVLLCFAEFARPVRCRATIAFGVQLAECTPVATLDSLSKLLNVTSYTHFSGINSTDLNMTSCETLKNGSLPEVKECTDAVEKSKLGVTKAACFTRDSLGFSRFLFAYNMRVLVQMQGYAAEGERAWQVAYEVLHDDKGWHHYKGSSLKKGRVYTKTYEGIGRTCKLEFHLDATPEQLQTILVDEIEEMASWNLEMSDAKILEKVNEDTTVVYMVTKPVAGGIVSSRDFVSVNHWKTFDGDATLLIQSAVTHPDVPPKDNIVRAYHRASGMMFRPVPNKPGKMLIEWTFSADIGVWLPQFLLDQAWSSKMLGFTKYVKNKLNSQ